MNGRAVLLLGMVILSVVPGLQAQNSPSKRFGIDPNLDGYPQKTAKDCLASVIKAIDSRHIDYLLAQLADPEFVDMRVKNYTANWFKVSEQTLVTLRSEGVSGEVLTKIKSLKDKNYSSEGVFLDELRRALATDNVDALRTKMMNAAQREAFQEMVQETAAKLAEDPTAVKELKRFAREGEWDADSTAVKLKDVKNRAVFLRKDKNDLWYFENRQK